LPADKFAIGVVSSRVFTLNWLIQCRPFRRIWPRLSQECFQAAGFEFEGDVVIRDEGAEPLRDVDKLEVGGCGSEGPGVMK
jgi:hypothetical protein